MTSNDFNSNNGHWRLINREAVLDMAMGDVEFLAEMVELFFSFVPQQMEEIKAAVEANDSERLAEAAHACKGTVGNYTRLEPFVLLQELENDGKAAKLDEARIKFCSLENEIAQLFSELKELTAEECNSI